jgi:hypothetical protein
LHVTFTGLDAATRPDDLRALSRDFPIEWGILFHPTREGSGRYPALGQIRSIAESDLKLRASVRRLRPQHRAWGEPAGNGRIFV